MTPKQKRAMRKGQLLMKRATPAMRAKWARKAAATRAAKRKYSGLETQSRPTGFTDTGYGSVMPSQGYQGLETWRMRGSNPFHESENPMKPFSGQGKFTVLGRRFEDLETARQFAITKANEDDNLHDFVSVREEVPWTSSQEAALIPTWAKRKVRAAMGGDPEYLASNPSFRSFLGGSSRGGISAGDSVTIKTPQGGTLRGRAVMPSSSGGWVINLGGSHGTPAVADEENIVSIKKKKSNPELMILSNPGKKRRKCRTAKRRKSSSRRRSRKGRKPVKIFLKKRKGAKLKYKGKTVSLKSLIGRLGKLGAGKYLKRSGKGSYRVKQIGYKKK